MGGILGRKPDPPVDPFYLPAGELITANPLEEFTEEIPPVSLVPPVPSMQTLYGRPNVSFPNVYANFYAQGSNQMPGIAPWNYGNYFLGNTAMQMMPADMFGSSLMSPYGLPSSFSMPMAAPMMAAATPLPIAFNPLVQGMYPMASENPVSWMNPSSFMSALSSGPMPYRPPGIDFPSNVGAVMTVPYGTPNPLLSPSASGGFSSPGSISYYGILPPSAGALPLVSYYPPPTSASQPYPLSYSNPIPVPSAQQLPSPQPPPVVAPPMVAGYNQAASHQVTSSLPNQGVDSYAPPRQVLSQASQPRVGLLDRFRNSLPSFSRSSHSTYDVTSSQSRRDPVIPPILQGELISDSGWLPLSENGKVISDSGWLPLSENGKVISDSGWLPKQSESRSLSALFGGKKRNQVPHSGEFGRSTIPSSGGNVAFHPKRRSHYSSSSASEYDCPICQQQLELRRLRKNYGSSTLSSLMSSPGDLRKQYLTTNDSILSSSIQGSTSSKQGASKSHRRHPIRIKSNSKTPSPKPSTSPIFLRKSPIAESINEPIQEEVFLEKQNLVETIHKEIELVSEQSD